MLLIFKCDSSVENIIVDESGRELYVIESSGNYNKETVMYRGNPSTVHSFDRPVQSVQNGASTVNANTNTNATNSGLGVIDPMIPTRPVVARIKYKMDKDLRWNAIEGRGEITMGDWTMQIKLFCKGIGWKKRYYMLKTLKPNAVVYNWECTQRSDLELYDTRNVHLVACYTHHPSPTPTNVHRLPTLTLFTQYPPAIMPLLAPNEPFPVDLRDAIVVQWMIMNRWWSAKERPKKLKNKKGETGDSCDCRPRVGDLFICCC